MSEQHEAPARTEKHVGSIYLKQNVFDAALERIHRLFDEFPQVVVDFSGGKDSTAVFQLALRVARERKRLPLNVLWIDQEAEWGNVVNYVRTVMNNPDVRPYWFQGPFRLFNATTTGADPWLHCWRDGDDWMRPKEPNSIHENITGTDRFVKLFDAISKTYWGDAPCAHLAGVRCEESPMRRLVLTNAATYKDITWGRVMSKRLGHYTFYPLYDWSYKDIWKAIHGEKWPYCRIYDYMHNYGVPPLKMRVSNIHHETAIASLQFFQEIEPDTWNRAVERLPSLNATNQCMELYKTPHEVPPMFSGWREYRDFLAVKLLTPENLEKIRGQCDRMEARHHLTNPKVETAFLKACIAAILVNDVEGIKLNGFETMWGSCRKTRGSRPLKCNAATNTLPGQARIAAAGQAVRQ